MRDRIDRGSPVPLYEQIATAIRWMVATGDIPRGASLEATRDAAERWGVNRHTVRQAYQRLVQWGLAESRPPHRFVIVTDVVPAAGLETDDERAQFFDEVLRHAGERFGLEPPRLIATLQHHVQGQASIESTVVVVECNTTQVEDHSRQIAARWGVRTLPFVLGRSDDLPPGPVVCTVFHFEDLRARWPHRQGDTRFIAVRPDPEMLRDVVDFLPDPKNKGEIVVLADESREEARNLAVDLQDLFPLERFDQHLAVRQDWQRRGDEGDRTLTLVGPRAWDALDSREQSLPHVVRIRYRIDAADLESLGNHFGWESVLASTQGLRV